MHRLLAPWTRVSAIIIIIIIIIVDYIVLSVYLYLHHFY
jgi:hypothetical protein